MILIPHYGCAPHLAHKNNTRLEVIQNGTLTSFSKLFIEKFYGIGLGVLTIHVSSEACLKSSPQQERSLPTDFLQH